MIKDLTVGKPSTVLWKFSVPMFIGVIFQQIYNIADSVIAGRFAGECLKMFMNEQSTQLAHDTGVDFFHIVTPFYFAICIKLIADGVLRGSGCMKQFIISTFADLLLRVILAFAFAGFWGTIGIWMSWPVGWTIGTVLAYVFYRKGFWKQQL